MIEQSCSIRVDRGVLRGIVHRPKERAFGVAIIQHGYFSGNHLGPAGLHVQTARTLATRGIATYRLDAYGVGDSDGLFSEVTYGGQVKDLGTVLQRVHLPG